MAKNNVKTQHKAGAKTNGKANGKAAAVFDAGALERAAVECLERHGIVAQAKVQQPVPTQPKRLVVTITEANTGESYSTVEKRTELAAAVNQLLKKSLPHDPLKGVASTSVVCAL